ncbi:isoprenylcysteine carboxylmethyltransferase family protein [Mycobacterium sp. Y57]|uniref:methyltransferase family protein n=1 Tax=Mycolicibacterium xanthum TaxID=2796469 RepID=UPI001C84B5E7|nr:isoprenylcysteine carboxylmethyltransferase family protein [Mycolicibacterium xanthum]MBX7432490.1 isoprenylcysteine carboxylmethyltransferase family protein [Mycolicibacterium xanthum]
MKIGLQMAASATIGLLVLGAALFLPAGTLHYRQGWLFIAVFVVCTLVPSGYLAVRSPAALQRRLNVGPTAETRPAQRVVICAAAASTLAVLVISALDWRFGWSAVPVWLVLAGDMLVGTGLVVAQLVVVQNNYAGASITVEDDQPLVSTGMYGVVRHPMYAASLVLTVGIPPALGSLWGLLVVALTFPPVLAVRILDEEKAMLAGLPGYREYMHRVRYRVIPGVW